LATRLIVGLLERIASLGFAGLMVEAIFMVHLHNGFFCELDAHTERRGHRIPSAGAGDGGGAEITRNCDGSP
jgi:uncharacterized membrane protein YphA (DoxX/SURF4 family)